MGSLVIMTFLRVGSGSFQLHPPIPLHASLARPPGCPGRGGDLWIVLARGSGGWLRPAVFM